MIKKVYLFRAWFIFSMIGLFYGIEALLTAYFAPPYNTDVTMWQPFINLFGGLILDAILIVLSIFLDWYALLGWHKLMCTSYHNQEEIPISLTVFTLFIICSAYVLLRGFLALNLDFNFVVIAAMVLMSVLAFPRIIHHLDKMRRELDRDYY